MYCRVVFVREWVRKDERRWRTRFAGGVPIGVRPEVLKAAKAHGVPFQVLAKGLTWHEAFLPIN